jgi:5-dehydro-4-deoxyglucarate dehydratase
VRTYTSSIANVAPRMSLALHVSAASGDRATLDRLMREYVVPLYAFRGRRKGYEVSVMKTLMDLQGQAGGRVRPPLNDVKPEEIKELKAMLGGWRMWL